VRRAAAPKLAAYAGLAGLGLLASLVLGLPELVALAAPFALVAAAGLVLTDEPSVDARVEVEPAITVEGEEVHAEVTVESRTPVERLDVFLEVPRGLVVADGSNPVAIRLEAREPRTLRLRLRAERWGGYAVGNVFVRTHDRLALLTYERRLEDRQPLKVFPRPEAIRSLLRPFETQVFTGNQVAREKGEGIEFADLRAFVAGDRMRRINWRASARRGALWVNEFHAERNTDVILFLDSFAEVEGAHESTLDRAVRGAAALAGEYLRHKYRIIDSLLGTEVLFNYAWKDLDVIPRRTLPPKALIIGLTPLLDERAVGALLDLRARGFDLAIIEISPVPFVTPGTEEIERLAHRLWLLRREALRARYEQVGVPVAAWNDEVPFIGALEEVRAFRRYAPPVSVS
jgi:uncharacterized protein (DUF58 family)